jgi:xylulokinase
VCSDLLLNSGSGEDDLLFLAYLDGERSPVWDTNASGVFIGLRPSHRLENLTRAVLDSVAFSLRQNLELVESAVPERTTSITATGGPAEGETWNEIKADVFGKSIVTQCVGQAGVLGAAMLAAVGSGASPSVEDAARSMASVKATFQPRSNSRARADRLFVIYKDTSVIPTSLGSRFRISPCLAPAIRR